jgi:hypothetical protein
MFDVMAGRRKTRARPLTRMPVVPCKATAKSCRLLPKQKARLANGPADEAGLRQHSERMARFKSGSNRHDKFEVM